MVTSQISFSWLMILLQTLLAGWKQTRPYSNVNRAAKDKKLECGAITFSEEWICSTYFFLLQVLQFLLSIQHLTWISKLLCNFSRRAHCAISICYWIIYVGARKDAVSRKRLLNTTTRDKEERNRFLKISVWAFQLCLLVPRKHTETVLELEIRWREGTRSGRIGC